MNEIIDVDFKEVIDLEEKTTEELKIEANNLYNQMETIGNIGLMLAAQAGSRLLIIKERLPHGGFETWCKENLKFSKRKAENMMKLSLKMDDDNSIFSKTQTFTDLGISKIWELLAAPEEVAEEVINNPDAADMSVKDFKEEIARLKKENEDENRRLNMENQKVKDLNKEIERLKKKIEEASDLSQSENEVAEKAKEILSLREKLKKEKENLKNKVQEEKDKLLAGQDKAIEEAVKKAKEKFDEEMEFLIEGNRVAATEIDKLKRKLDSVFNTDLAVFKVKADQLQIDYNSCLKSIDAVKEKDMEQAQKMYSALRKVIDIMAGQLPC